MREERDVPIVTELASTIGFEISDYSQGHASSSAQLKKNT